MAKKPVPAVEDDRYLDSSKVLRELEAAEQAHQLDAQGVLDELARAVGACNSKIAGYLEARCAYFAEVKRRLNETGGNLRQWCIENKIPRGTASVFALIGEAVEAGEDFMQAKRRLLYGGRSSSWEYARSVQRREDDADPLAKAKRIWRLLSPLQQHALMRWQQSHLRLFSDTSTKKSRLLESERPSA